MPRILILILLAGAVPAAAQVQSRPVDPPLVTAASEAWYVQREPIQLGGELYYPAGATVFFDGNTMARVGHYNGVPLYVDTTIEPYSILLVPIRRGLMQPYERRRQGDLVGTTGSRTPAFPVATGSAPAPAIAQAAMAPTQPQLSIGAIGVFTPGGAARPDAAPAPADALRPALLETPAVPARQDAVVSLARPESNDGVWIRFKGGKWVSAGAAVPLRAAEFHVAGEYAGFPVFVRTVNGTIDPGTIYLPTRPGLVAPYRMK